MLRAGRAMQVAKLTDAQIDATYAHFEHGGSAPKGVTLKATFTQTMGRAWLSDEDGGKFIPV